MDLLNKIWPEFGFLVTEQGFEIRREEHSPINGGAAYIQLHSPRLDARLILDRTQLFAEVRGAAGEWRDLHLIFEFLDGSYSPPERFGPADMAYLATMLRSNWSKVVSLMGTDETESSLANLIAGKRLERMAHFKAIQDDYQERWRAVLERGVDLKMSTPTASALTVIWPEFAFIATQKGFVVKMAGRSPKYHLEHFVLAQSDCLGFRIGLKPKHPFAELCVLTGNWYPVELLARTVDSTLAPTPIRAAMDTTRVARALRDNWDAVTMLLYSPDLPQRYEAFKRDAEERLNAYLQPHVDAFKEHQKRSGL